jgi:hypothetical protein
MADEKSENNFSAKYKKLFRKAIPDTPQYFCTSQT